MTSNAIRRFNMFNLQHGSDYDIHIKIQETVYYAESRFLCILKYITEADEDRQDWCQKLLHRELLFVLSYIGIATSIGQVLHIPIIIRSLADSISMLREDNLPVDMEHDFLLTLDIDASDNSNKCRIVKRYEHAWWDKRKPRSLDLPEILNGSSVNKCLEFHKAQLSPSAKGRDIHQPVTSSLPRLQSPSDPAGITDAQLAINGSEYSQILSESLNDILDVHRYSNAMMTSAETQWNLDMRRASTFYLLHETAVIKEMDSTTPAVGLSHNPDRIKSVAENAQAELDRLRALPPSSYKWTWGKPLSETDILDLRKSRTHLNKAAHSGYFLPLRSGPLHGQESAIPSMPASDVLQMGSAIPSMPTSHGVHDEMPDISPLPEYTLSNPSYFDDHNYLTYDPLGALPVKSASDISVTENTKLLAKISLSAGDNKAPATRIADEWSSEHETHAVEIADQWSSAGEENIQGSEPKAPRSEHETHAVEIADQWSSAGEENTQGSEPKAPRSASVQGQLATAAAVVDTAYLLAEMSTAESKEPLSRLAEEWSSASDGSVGRIDIAEQWSSADEQNEPNVAEVWSSASDDDKRSFDGLADEWVSERDDNEASAVSQLTRNSQFLLTPGRTTINPPLQSFSHSEPWPGPFDNLPSHPHEGSPLPVLEVGGGRRFGPEDFSFLHDDMFEEGQSEEDEGR